MEMSKPRGHSIFIREAREQFVKRQDEVRIFGQRICSIEQLDPDTATAPFLSIPITGVIDQDAAHGFGRGGKEVASAVELLLPDQPQICFVNECRGIERVPRRFRSHPGSGQLPQFIIDKRKEFHRGLAIPFVGSFNEAS